MDSTSNAATELFWDLAAEFQAADERVVEGTIMGSPCLRVAVIEVDENRWRALLAEGIDFVG